MARACGAILLLTAAALCLPAFVVPSTAPRAGLTTSTSSASAELPTSSSLSAAPAVLAAAGLVVLAQRQLVTGRRADGKINNKVSPEVPKVVTKEDLEAGAKKVYCRCWLSGTFPLCDGAHAKHNDETGDNVGPLIVSVKKSG
ncbi:unnamed protein product [Durusdinium trenchii]|uniref:Iron-binding zinc finger CDGSH type domain-containing protein n=2 Tax=Durusdinium trenchii TaxID=1381693 RepID=A0ABP0QMJ5_9DINO